MIKNTFAFLVCTVALFAATESSAQSLLRRAGRPEASAEAAPAAASADAAEPKEVPALNWDAAPVDIVLQAYAEQLDKTILKDPAAPTPTITLKTREGQKLTKEEYLEAIEVVLEMNGIHLEPYGERFIRALPRKDVRKEGIPLIMDPETKLGDSGRVVSMMIPFKNIGTEEAQKALEGFKSNSGILLVFERTNSILVTDTEQNINRMLEIARSIDIATPVLENVFVRQVKNASAQDIKTALEAIVQESQKELEKNGKAANNQNAGASSTPGAAGMMRPGARLLGARPGANNNQAPQPVNNESLVMSVSDADRGMIRGKVLILADERSNKLIIVTQKANMDFFDKVIEQLDVETTPDTVVKVYRLKYAEAEEVSDMINDLIGNSSSSSSRSGQNQNANAKSGSGGNLTRNNSQTASSAKKPANQRSGEAKAGELTKENTTVLADKRINGIVVMTEKELVPTIEQIIESMDVKLSQVLIETVIIEVTLGDDLKTGIDWVMRGRNRTSTTTDVGTGTYSQRLTGYEKSSTLLSADAPTSVSVRGNDGYWWNPVYEFVENTVPVNKTTLTRDGLVNGNNYMLGGGGGNGSGVLSTMMSVGTNVANNAVWGGASPISGGLNYFLKSDKLNLASVIQASKTDSRSKYIASPIVMTVDNKEATIDATENRQFLTGWTAQSGSYGNSGQPTPNYSAKDIGIKLKITPKINPNGTVMLTVEEEYSQFHENGQSMLIPQNGVYTQGAVDLAVERKMSADILLDNMQTVVLGGLTETTKSESETGIPILKDIPWIGKWLFGSVSQTEGRKELLVFMTPYVLDDGEMAQAEAIRRKKSLSDARPWEDHGWSASELADPVSKKEQMRRLKDEWKKQDEERKTKLAIEEEKIKRAKALEAMSEEERRFWLEMHKDELEDDKQKELEEKMLDKDSQEELRQLAESIRDRKLAEANAAIDKADEAARQENERGQMVAKKAEDKAE